MAVIRRSWSKYFVKYENSVVRLLCRVAFEAF